MLCAERATSRGCRLKMSPYDFRASYRHPTVTQCHHVTTVMSSHTILR